MQTKPKSPAALIWLAAALLAIFVGRSLLAIRYDIPRLSDLFAVLTIAGSLVVWGMGYHSLRRSDYLAALLLGLAVGVGMLFATLFTPYPFWGIIRTSTGQALVRGLQTAIAALGGLTIMRQGGPISLHAAKGDRSLSIKGVLVGLAFGVPLAVLNMFALRMTEGQGFSWQPLPAAALDALQPAVVEEVVYRFAFWGLAWLLLRRSLSPDKAVWVSGLLALLVHNYIHFDELWIENPLMALGFGAVMGLVWGVPHAVLARRRGLESATAFHWIQDFLRFFAGF